MFWYFASCSSQDAVRRDLQQTTPPSSLLGEFEDDYGIRYTISAQEWFQHPATRYVVQWRSDDQYLIAQNHEANPSDPGLWTRIDWVLLSEMQPYEWAYCLSAYDASTAAEAEQTVVAKRDTPRTGCNGFPFSRMRRVASGGDSVEDDL